MKPANVIGQIHFSGVQAIRTAILHRRESRPAARRS
jgi:hypothetical protein